MEELGWRFCTILMTNRIIKFRAWDGEKKVMLKAIDLSASISTYGWLGYNDFRLMQYTGLLDSKGREIYEGDLFKCIYDFDGCTEHIMEVIYDQEGARFHLKNHGEPCHQQGVVKHIWDFESKEIIGNIYENKELIK